MESTQVKRPLLPLQKLIDDTYRLVWRYKGEYFKIAWCWLALAILVLFLFDYCGQALPAFKALQQKTMSVKAPGDASQFMGSPYPLLVILWGGLRELVTIFFGVSVAVAWHRLILLKEQVHEPYYLRFDNVVRDYFLVASILMLIEFAPGFIAALLGTASRTLLLLSIIVGMAGIVIAVNYTVRLTVILPARALGVKNIPFGEVLQRTRSNFWRLAIGPFICALPVVLLMLGASFVLGVSPKVGNTPVTQALYSSLSTALYLGILAPFYLTFLSLSFRHFFPEEAESVRI